MKRTRKSVCFLPPCFRINETSPPQKAETKSKLPAVLLVRG
uniref:Uncharacterized protein n=1 Tax=Anguilla anguilla TaxID=7936 RepID=A0A0E9UBY3_ANGAN